MGSDQLQNLLRQCLSTGDKSDWARLKEEFRKEENCPLREELRRLGNLKQEDFQVEEDKMWEVVSLCRSAGHRHSKLGQRVLRYAAVLLLPLIVGMAGWWLHLNLQKTADETEAVLTVIGPGQPKAILELSDGRQIDLSVIVQDTVWDQHGTIVILDSSHCLSYLAPSGGEKETIYNTVFVPRTGEYRLVLADGTVVWLNADSELKYPVRFTGNQRKVFLRGEAYFEVTKNEKWPFTVEVGPMEVKVLGTRFNINASRVDGGWQTTLVEGKVCVSDNRVRKQVVLYPDQQAMLKEGQLTIAKVNAEVYTAWRQGKFYFENETLEEIAAQLERWYDVQISFSRESLKRERFTGVIRRDYTADRILEVIEKTTDVQFAVQGRTIIVQ